MNVILLLLLLLPPCCQVLWNHINKDWIATQEQKKARADAAAAAAAMEASIRGENMAAVAAAEEEVAEVGRRVAGLVVFSSYLA